LNALAEHKSFTIGVQEITDYRPYSQYTNNIYKGFNRDLFELFADYGDYHFNFEVLPLKRLNRQFLQGEVDFRYPDNKYWDTETKGDLSITYSSPVVRYIDGVLVKPENKGKGVQTLRTLGVILGYTPYPYQELINSKQLTIFQNSNIQRLINQVIRGQNSGIYINVAVGLNQLKSLSDNSEGLVFDPDLPHVVSTRHLSSIKFPEIINKFNLFLLEKKHEIERLKSQYQVEKILEFK